MRTKTGIGGIGPKTMVVAWAVLVLACHSLEASAPDGAEARQARLHRADMALAKGEPGLAAPEYRAVLSEDPECTDALVGLARALTQMGDPVGALTAYDALRRIDAARFAALGHRERCRTLAGAIAAQLDAGDADSALEAAMRVPELGCAERVDPALLARSRLARAEALAETDSGRAIDLYREAIRLDPPASTVFVRVARLLLGDGRREEALELLILGLEEHPDSMELKEFTVEVLADS